jgi:hypothetical protein
MPYSNEELKKLPDKPGVYIMRGRQGVVLYIGKAINIRSRVRQYFAPGYDLRPMIPLLVSKVETIDTIVVTSEKEAFLLENNLIKQHKPKYNVLLKDDKSYIALKINNKDPWPRLQLVRYRGRPKADGLYFGPYTSLGERIGFDNLLKQGNTFVTFNLIRGEPSLMNRSYDRGFGEALKAINEAHQNPIIQDHIEELAGAENYGKQGLWASISSDFKDAVSKILRGFKK